MKTEVIISIIAVVVILAIIAYVVYKKDRFTLAGTYMTPLEIAIETGYSQIVDYLYAQAKTNNDVAQPGPSIIIAQWLVNIINCGVSEDSILGIIISQYRDVIYEDAITTYVLVQNCDLP